jgi:8-oxo-dGTP diphosphatase
VVRWRKARLREAALIREIKEELDTVIAVDKIICTVECDYTEFHLTMHSFLCHVVEGRLQLLEAEDARWLDKAHINDVNWLPADREVIKNL